MNEQDIIRRIAARGTRTRRDVVLGIGDDAALIRAPAGHELVVSTDSLVAGIHFPVNTSPAAIGHKALAVNLSDIAAMGAEPAWFTLNLALPEADAEWLERFCDGLFALADEFGVVLIGGDTDRAPLAAGVQIIGFAPPGKALRRSGARAGDSVFVTGTLGDAMLGLEIARGSLSVPEVCRAALLARFEYPTPRVAVGVGLRGLASACVDISDGLARDLGHVLEASGVGATLSGERLPYSDCFRRAAPPHALARALNHGDDYELVFTVPATRGAEVARLAARTGCPITEIGRIEAAPGLRIRDTDGAIATHACTGHDHFAR